MDLWICASVQYGNERMPVWEGRESAIFVFISLLHVLSPFLYFHILTHTVFMTLLDASYDSMIL